MPASPGAVLEVKPSFARLLRILRRAVPSPSPSGDLPGVEDDHLTGQTALLR